MWTFWLKFYQMVSNQFLLIPVAAWLKTTANQIQAVKTLRYNCPTIKNSSTKSMRIVFSPELGLRPEHDDDPKASRPQLNLRTQLTSKTDDKQEQIYVYEIAKLKAPYALLILPQQSATLRFLLRVK
jgi:hypothetical protein